MNAQASTSRLSLDLDCPIAWPTCTAATATTASSLDPINERYHHALYLGEQHTPLEAFVAHSRRRIAQYGAEESRASLLALLRSAPPKEHKALLALDASSLRSLVLASAADVASDVERVRRAALTSGPGSVVGEEMKGQVVEKRRKKEEEERQETQVAAALDEEEIARHGRWATKWVEAIETRDLQLQALVLLLLLRISAEHPQLEATASQAVHETLIVAADNSALLDESQVSGSQADVSMEEASTTTKRRRKRKVEARRNAGLSGYGFSWAPGSTQGPPPSPSQQMDDVQLWHKVDAQSLARRFDLVIRQLNLLNTKSFISIASGPSPISISSARTSDGAAQHASASFGTAGRVRAPGDERDELQWLCTEIIEPYFGRALPRQVEIVRGAAFVPGLPGATPARRKRLISSGASIRTPGGGIVSSPLIDEPEAGTRGLGSAADLDLGRRKAQREQERREAEAQRLAKRPRLAEALQKEVSKTSNKGVSAAKREMKRAGAREVSVGLAARSTSIGPAGFGAGESSLDGFASCEAGASLGPTLNAAASRINKRKALAHRRLDNVGSLSSSTTSLKQPSTAATASSISASTMRNWRRAESQPVGRHLFARVTNSNTSSSECTTTLSSGFTPRQAYPQTQPLDDPLAWSDDEEMPSSFASTQRMAPKASQSQSQVKLRRFGRTGSISASASSSLAGGTTRGPFTRADSQPVAAAKATASTGASIGEARSAATLEGTSSQRAPAAAALSLAIREGDEEADMEMLVTRKRISAKPLFTWSASQQQSQSQGDAWGESSQQSQSQSQDAAATTTTTTMAHGTTSNVNAVKRNVSGRNPFAARSSLSSLRSAALDEG